MSVKKAMRIWLASVLAAGLALGEGVPAGNGREAGDSDPDPASLPGSRAHPPPAPDLDFSEDFPSPNLPTAGASVRPGSRVTKTLPRDGAAPRKTHAWAWWTAGLAALTAGGAAWYLHYGAGSPPDPVIRNQDFTDEAD